MNVHRSSTWVAAVVVLALAGCARNGEMAPPETGPAAEEGQTPAAGNERMRQRMRAACPMMVEGTRVDVDALPRAVGLRFTTDTDVEELRDRVRTMAAMYEMHDGRGRMMWHRMGQRMQPGQGRGMGPRGGRGPMAGQPMPEVNTRVEHTERGALLVLEPTDPEQLDGLRQRMQMHAQRMSDGQCWMLRSQRRPQPAPAPPSGGPGATEAY